MHEKGLLDFMSGAGPFLGLLAVIVIAFSIVGLAATLRWISRDRGAKEDRNVQSAPDILRCRYARGEISEEDYIRMKRNVE
jgi:uncharacterized membrane protein